MAFDEGFQAASAFAEFFVGQFVGAGGGAGHQVRDAEAEVGEEVLFGRVQEAVGEAGAVQGLPEAVAGTGEMVADGAG